MTADALAGLRVLELGQLIAGPFAGSMLAGFGAELIKVEAPGTGDPLRKWRKLHSDGTSLWWRSMARNKRSIAVDLRTERGRSLIRELVATGEIDVEVLPAAFRRRLRIHTGRGGLQAHGSPVDDDRRHLDHGHRGPAGTDNGQVASGIPKTITLLEGQIMLFVNDDEAKIRKRRKYRGAGT